MTSPPLLPRGAVFDNTFESAVGPIQAGTSFALGLPGLPPLLVTCQHLFGPAGGLTEDVPPHLMPRFVPSASVAGACGDGVTAKAGAALLIPGVDADQPARDLAAFPLASGAGVAPLRPGSAKQGDRVFLLARLRKGAPPGTWLFPADVAYEQGDLTEVIFDDPEIHMPGTSGAPVIDAGGAFLGMVVRFRQLPHGISATLLRAEAIAALLQGASLPPPPRGLWSRLFG